MKIELKRIKVRDLVKEYSDNDEEGVFGLDGKLNIRPKYQREFVYKEKQRNAVIETLRQDFPLNVMYWSKNDDGTFEVMDGQQRTISICEYVIGNFSLNFQYFHNLEKEEQQQILDYELMVYFCEGTSREKLDWFKIINIAGEELTDQELRNAIYTGPWLTDAKRHFSKTQGPAVSMAGRYLKGDAIRQEHLQTALRWISAGNIEDYMSENQHKPDAGGLWRYFQQVIGWVESIFANYRKEMKGVEFGILFNEFKDKELFSSKLEEEIVELMQDEEVTNKKGIYFYVLTRDQKHLNLRRFNEKMKREAYERQKGVCPITNQKLAYEEMEADHIIPWSKGGKTNADNCQMISRKANREKSNK